MLAGNWVLDLVGSGQPVAVDFRSETLRVIL
jgi:hypothetical protein